MLADISEPSDAVLRLIELAISGGGPDNITCIVADVIDTSESKLKATKTPVAAGAAASNALNDTKPISRPKAGGDSGVTQIGTLPASAGLAVGADGGKATRARTRPNRSPADTASARATSAGTAAAGT